jgi:phage FluMu gp28-like protein
MFFQLISEGRMPYYRVRRSDAYAMGAIKIYSAVTGQPITPEQARAEASDKRAYDQNYECTFEDENMPLLTQELIDAAMRVELLQPDRQEWSIDTIQRLYRAEGVLECGWDFARNRDLSVITVLERIGETRRMIAELIMEDLRTPQQNAQARVVCTMPRFRRLEIDMTGNGTGAYDYLVDEFSDELIGGVHFASTEPITARIATEGRKTLTAKVTEIMATDLRGCFEDKTLEIFQDPELRDDLRKPEKIVSPGGRVSIAASRDGVRGHADRFWALALAVRAGYSQAEVGTFRRFHELAVRIAEQTAGVVRSAREKMTRQRRGCVG